MSQLFKSQSEKSNLKKVFHFLFGKPAKDDGDFLDMRTDISTKEMFQAIIYYRTLDEYFHCKAAKTIANLLERLSISSSRKGREEAVKAILAVRKSGEGLLLRGIEESLKDSVKGLE